MPIWRLKPSLHTAIWGGQKLISEYNKKSSLDKLAESWELSAHPSGPCEILNGDYKGMLFSEMLKNSDKLSVFGENCSRFDKFPILVKLIDAKDNLSVQVHPNDDYAEKNEGQYGKTEVWYVLEAEEGAKLCYGCKRTVSKEEFRKHIEDNSVEEVLNYVSVKKGDVFFIEAGTIHAIGKGIVIAEIQQSSDLTYRVYDYGRRDDKGNCRELHVEKALEVARLESPTKSYDFEGHLAFCKYFAVDLLSSDDAPCERDVDGKSFAALLITDGSGYILNGKERAEARKGDCFFLPAGSGKYSLNGKIEALEIRVPEER